MKAIALGLVPSLVVLLATACGNDQPAKTPSDHPAQIEDAAPAPTATSSELLMDAGPSPTAAAPTPNVSPAPAAAPVESAPALTDGQILHVTHLANAGEIEQAKLAEAKSHDARVRKLAAMMIKDHSMADAKGKTIAKKASLTLSDSPTSKDVESDASGNTSTLKGESGAAFDKDYVGIQIKEHQAVLDILDQKLIPAAKSDDVKTYLTEVRAKVAMHLQHAQDLSNDMQK
jgi:putative membrane protein